MLPGAAAATALRGIPSSFSESALMLHDARAESGDELPERAVSAETVGGEKRLLLLGTARGAANSE